jgi:hypothetical protein
MAAATPDEVPVATTSPGSSVTTSDSAATSVKQSKMRCLVLESWRTSPFTLVVMCRL